ncbi:MAG: YqgE/AlgH family protein [Betaproteobacteria bacterium]|nr:YqgE/AlgH family protein [Betaproteobacteria bacterium]
MLIENVNLTGHFLIAMPNLTDPYFARSVAFICSHTQEGAMGIVINRPTDMTYESLYEKINIPLENSTVAHKHVLYGGPVQLDRGFVLHPANELTESEWDSSMSVCNQVMLTTSRDILQAVAQGTGPEHLLLSLGYAGWSQGQLEDEMAQNAWLSVKAPSTATLNKILFATPHEEQLNIAISLLGFDPMMLSDEAGHA